MNWVDAVTAVYGKPGVCIDKPAPMKTEHGPCVRQAWAWFPGRSNHHISIDAYPNGTWVVLIGSHYPAIPDVEWRAHVEPGDATMHRLLNLTGFLATRTDADGKLADPILAALADAGSPTEVEALWTNYVGAVAGFHWRDCHTRAAVRRLAELADEHRTEAS